MAVAAVYAQTGFRFRNDDGSETNATWKAATNAVITIALGIPFRLRFLIAKDAAAASDIQQMILHESHNGGTFNIVRDNGTSITTTFISSFYEDEDICTQQIGSGLYNTTVNNACMMNEERARTGLTTYAADASNEREQEMEATLVIKPGAVSNGDTIEYRMREAGTAYAGGYSEVPIITIVKSGLRISGGTLKVTGGTLKVIGG